MHLLHDEMVGGSLNNMAGELKDFLIQLENWNKILCKGCPVKTVCSEGLCLLFNSTTSGFNSVNLKHITFTTVCGSRSELLL